MAYAAWLTRKTWTPLLPALSWGHAGPRLFGSINSDTTWLPLTERGAARADQTIARLGAQTGTVFVSVPPADFAAYMVMDIVGKLPPPRDTAVAQARSGALRLRTALDLKRLGGQTSLGPLGTLLHDRERLELAGTFDVLRRGVAEFRVDDVRLGDIPVPQALIPTLVHRVENGPHPAGLASNGLLLNVPPYVGDIRVTNGGVSVYKAVP
jgi:hypothetical protein